MCRSRGLWDVDGSQDIDGGRIGYRLVGGVAGGALTSEPEQPLHVNLNDEVSVLSSRYPNGFPTPALNTELKTWGSVLPK
jgi:hypothetical protein